MSFKREILGEFAIDHEYEQYLACWMVYHQTADQIDGHIKYPTCTEEYETVRLAGKLAINAQSDFMYMMGIKIPSPKYSPEGWKKWNAAKLEALRRLGK